MSRRRFAQPLLLLAIVLTFVLGSGTPVFANPATAIAKLKSELLAQSLIAQFGLERLGSTSSQLTLLSQTVTTDGAHDFAELKLGHKRLGVMQLLLRGPRGFLNRTDHSLRTIFLASGFVTGRTAVQLLGEEENTVIAGFIYGASVADFQQNPINAPILLTQFLHETPLQMAVTMGWLSQAAWLKPHSLTAIGVSLGGILLPLSLRIAHLLEAPIGGAVFAFTGAHLAPIVEHHLKAHLPNTVLAKTLQVVNNLTSIIDPKLHLPALSGRFLVLRANRDQVFPLESAQILYELLPQPKSLVEFDGPHIDVDQPDLIKRAQLALRSWLLLSGL